jgi:hypothetical protein
MQGPSTSSPTSNPIGPESTTSSPSSTSVTVASPSTTGSSATGQSQSSGGGGVVTSAGSSSSSTASSSTSKGEAGRMINAAGDGSLMVRTHAEAPVLVKLTQFSPLVNSWFCICCCLHILKTQMVEKSTHFHLKTGRARK